MAIEYFQAYHSYLQSMEPLNDAECGRLFRALLKYSETGECEELRGNERFIFPTMRAQIDRDKNKYVKQCHKNAENGKHGGRPKNPENPVGFFETEKSQGKGEREGEGKDKDKGIYERLRALYNETCVSFPRCVSLSEKRKKALSARLRHHTIEDFRKLFEKAEKSSFLKGSNNRNWSATFDWLISDANMAKVLDGNYDDKVVKKSADWSIDYDGQDF